MAIQTLTDLNVHQYFCDILQTLIPASLLNQNHTNEQHHLSASVYGSLEYRPFNA